MAFVAFDGALALSLASLARVGGVEERGRICLLRSWWGKPSFVEMRGFRLLIMIIIGKTWKEQFIGRNHPPCTSPSITRYRVRMARVSLYVCSTLCVDKGTPAASSHVKFMTHQEERGEMLDSSVDEDLISKISYSPAYSLLPSYDHLQTHYPNVDL